MVTLYAYANMLRLPFLTSFKQCTPHRWCIG